MQLRALLLMTVCGLFFFTAKATTTSCATKDKNLEVQIVVEKVKDQNGVIDTSGTISIATEGKTEVFDFDFPIDFKEISRKNFVYALVGKSQSSKKEILLATSESSLSALLLYSDKSYSLSCTKD